MPTLDLHVLVFDYGALVSLKTGFPSIGNGIDLECRMIYPGFKIYVAVKSCTEPLALSS